MELGHYLARNLDKAEVEEKIKILLNLRNMNIIDFNKALMNHSLEHLTKYAKSMGLGGRDSTILASLDMMKIESLFTHDESLKTLDENWV